MKIIEPCPGGVKLQLHLQPRASKTELAEIHGAALKVRVAAPPVDGAANRELVRFLAEILGVPGRSVEIVSGLSGRQKLALVRGITPAAAAKRLGVARDPGPRSSASTSHNSAD